MKHLLPPNIIQPRIEIPHARRQVLQLALVAALDRARLANRNVQRQPDPAVGRRHRQPVGPPTVGRRREAQLVVAWVRRREGELARGAAPLGDDAVVVVEDFL